MPDKTLADTITPIVKTELSQLYHPIKATITRVYNNGNVDIQTTEYGALKNIQTIIPHTNGDETILIFLNNNPNTKMVI